MFQSSPSIYLNLNLFCQLYAFKLEATSLLILLNALTQSSNYYYYFDLRSKVEKLLASIWSIVLICTLPSCLTEEPPASEPALLVCLFELKLEKPLASSQLLSVLPIGKAHCIQASFNWLSVVPIGKAHCIQATFNWFVYCVETWKASSIKSTIVIATNWESLLHPS